MIWFVRINVYNFENNQWFNIKIKSNGDLYSFFKWAYEESESKTGTRLLIEFQFGFWCCGFWNFSKANNQVYMHLWSMCCNCNGIKKMSESATNQFFMVMYHSECSFVFSLSNYPFVSWLVYVFFSSTKWKYTNYFNEKYEHSSIYNFVKLIIIYYYR